MANFFVWLFCLCAVVSWEASNGVHGSKPLRYERRSHKSPEVFIFSVTNQNWHQYNWEKITTVVECGYHDADLLKYAHSWNASVSFIASFPVEALTNSTLRKTWIDQQVTYLTQNKLDGINIDFEEELNCSDQPRRDGFTQLMKELSTSLRSVSPNVQITIDFAWAPPHIDNRCYDYKAISDIVDFAFVMSYDERSQITGPCIAWANSPYNMTIAGIKEYFELSIPVSKLVLGVPWYGYDYPCISYQVQDNMCYINPVPFRGVSCSDAAGKQYGYSNLMDRLKNSTTGRLWDEDAKSPYFTYTDPMSLDVHQVWFDDKESLKLKYDMALDLGLRGVGMWEADSLDYDSPDKQQYLRDMWDTLP